MLSFLKREKSKKLENQLNTLQKEGPAAWADLPEDELFTPAGFSEERAEATSYSNYSYWGSTFRAFFKNKIAVALLIALVFVVGFARYTGTFTVLTSLLFAAVSTTIRYTFVASAPRPERSIAVPICIFPIFSQTIPPSTQAVLFWFSSYACSRLSALT